MKITYNNVTDAPHFHDYKNAFVIQIEVECDCGEKAKDYILIENTTGLKLAQNKGE